MDKIETFNQFLVSSDTGSFSYVAFGINMLLALLIALLIKYTYTKCGTSVSNRKYLSDNFPLLVLTTVFIITIVKSSLALSLGLVGALSIVRFRTAIKEPIELIYLFLCIAVGLGLGANQKIITIIATLLVLGYIWLKFLIESEDKQLNDKMILSIEICDKNNIQIQDIINLLKKSCDFVNLIRLEESQDKIEANFDVSFISLEKMNMFRNSAKSLSNDINILIIDNKGFI